MELAHVLRPVFSTRPNFRFNSGGDVDLVYQNINPLRRGNQRVTRACITGNNNGPIWSVDAVGVSFSPTSMRHLNRSYTHSVFLVDHVLIYLVNIHAISTTSLTFQAIGPNLDVFGKSLQQQTRHAFETEGTVDFQRPGSAHNPGCQDQIRIAKREIRMQVGTAHCFWAAERKAGRIYVSHQASTSIEKENAITKGNCRRRPGSMGIGIRGSRA